MGLAPLLVDTYRKYKKGTGNFVQWLAETAHATGALDEVFKNCLQEATKATGGRLKGKARKENKKAITSPATTFQVPIKYFGTLAKAIADAKHVPVPLPVFKTLRAIIRGRKDCANWYSLNTDLEDDTTKENNARHQYCIKVLEDVLDILQLKQSQVSHTRQKAAATGRKHVTNMYEHLELEEADELDDMPEVIASSVKDAAAYTLETSDADISFAIFCFLKDATHIRLSVRRTWREFKRGDIGLQAAALSTNAAIAMIEKLSTEFEKAYPQFQGNKMHPEIINFLYQGYCQKGDGPAFIDPGDEEDDPFTYREGGQKLHPNTLMCTHTTDLVISFFLSKPDHRARLSGDEKRFLKCLSQLAALPMTSIPGKPDKPCKSDLVHKAVWSMANNHQLSTWSVFAMQIFWDTRRELGSMSQTGYQLLSKTAEELMESWQVYLDTKGLDKVGKLHKKFRGDYEARMNDIQAMVLNSTFQDWLCAAEKQCSWMFEDIPGFSLLQCHPALCGLILADIRDEHHTCATNMAGDQGQILVAAHFYNAAHRSGLLPKETHWTDMDWFIEQQGSSWIFVGERPEQGFDFAKRLSLARGLGITQFAKDYKIPKSGMGDDGYDCAVGQIRRLDFLARLSQLSYERQEKPYKKISGESRAKEDILVMVDALTKDYLGSKGVSTDIPSLETLRTFKNAVQRDEFAFNFDVMDLYLRCIRLLRSIQTHCLTHAPLDYPKEPCGKGLGMNTVIQELLHDLGGKPRHNGVMFPQAVAMLRKVIDEEGSVVLTKAEARQQETKPQQTEPTDELEPSFENPPEDTMPLEMRNLFSDIVFQDENGDCRMPFGFG